MNGPRHTAASARHRPRLRDTVRRAFGEFLGLPTLVIIGFVVLAVGSYLVDASALGRDDPVRTFLQRHAFRDAKATSDLLGTIAGGVITVTSITISLLLVAIQQSASTMTTQVFDQFLRRWHNQFYFGFFVGLTFYALLTLSTVTESFNPVYGGTIAVLLTVTALYLLILLLYTTINQMRPAEIVEAIHEHTLAARRRQLDLVRCVRRTPRLTDAHVDPVHSERHGFVTHIALAAVGTIAERCHARGADAEIVLRVSIGTYVSFGDILAEIRTANGQRVPELSRAVQSAIRVEAQRDIAFDAAFGIEQLEMIGWTSISSSKSSPAPGLLSIRALRDLLTRWSAEEQDIEAERERATLPVVYHDDPFGRLFDTLESLGVVASESMQHQSLAEVVRALAVTYGRVPVAWRSRADDVVLRLLPSLGEHVLTRELDAALAELVSILETSGGGGTARALARAHRLLRQSVGRLGSRATRATPAAGASET